MVCRSIPKPGNEPGFGGAFTKDRELFRNNLRNLYVAMRLPTPDEQRALPVAQFIS